MNPETENKQNFFLIGLLLQDSHSLASQLALWKETDIWKIAYTCIKEPPRLTTSIAPKLMRRIESTTENMLHNSTPSLQADIIEFLMEYLDIQKRPNPSVTDLNEICRKICEKSVQVLKSTEKGKFTGNDTSSMILYCLKQQFEELQKQFEKMPTGQQDEIIEHILQTLQEMPPDQHSKILKEINAEKISQDAIRKAITTGTLGTALIAVVQIAGFSAYIFAVKILAGITGLVGITLPFVAYTTLTSLIAFLTNPLVFGALFIFGSHYLKKSVRKKIRNKLLPVIVSSTLVVGYDQDIPSPDPEPLLTKLRYRWVNF